MWLCADVYDLRILLCACGDLVVFCHGSARIRVARVRSCGIAPRADDRWGAVHASRLSVGRY